MIITFGKYNLKKYFFLFVPIIKIIRESSNFSSSFYNVKNILIQYFFLCVAKFANFIFWFILEKKISFPKRTSETLSKNEERFTIIPDNNNGIEQEKLNSKNALKGLSQKEINLNEKKLKRKKKCMKEIILLIISSLIDFISNFSYLISYASISNNADYNNETINNTTNYDINNNITSNNSYSPNNESKENDNVINLIPFRICIRIILIYIFSLIFLYLYKPYRHQLISLLLIVLIVVSADIIEYFLNIIKINDDFLIHLILSFFQELFFSLDNVIGAKFLSISNGNVYQLLFFNGAFGILMITIINFLTGKIHCNQLNLDDKFCDNNNLKSIFNFTIDKRIIYFLISLVLSIIEMACTWLLIFYQTVNHLSVACAIHLIFRFVIGRFNIIGNHIIIGIICLILISFFSLVYNEIIILRFCQLEKDTFEEIERRAIEDKNLIGRLSIDTSNEEIIYED